MPLPCSPSSSSAGTCATCWLPACSSLQADLARADLSADIWVVDNGSTDGTPEAVARDFPAVRLLARRDNPGFAAANNQALRAALETPRPATSGC